MPIKVKDEPLTIVKLTDAYILGLSPLSIFGALHWYLKNKQWAKLYLFTFGLCGFGYITDWFRIDRLVDPDYSLDGDQARDRLVWDCYVFAASPFGVLGAHHLYLRRYRWFFCHFFTLGFGGLGLIYDLFRMDNLVDAYIEKFDPYSNA